MKPGVLWLPPFPDRRLSALSFYLSSRLGRLLYLGGLLAVCSLAAHTAGPPAFPTMLMALSPVWLSWFLADVVVARRENQWGCAMGAVFQGWSGPSAPKRTARVIAAAWIDVLRYQAPMLPPTAVKADLDGGIVLVREAPNGLSSVVAVNPEGDTYYAILDGSTIRESIALPKPPKRKARR